MRKIIFIAEGRLSDKNQKTNDKFISFTDIEGDEKFAGEGEYYNHTEFADLIKKITPDDITFNFDSQDEFDYIIDLIKEFVVSLRILSKSNLIYDLTPLEKCSKLESVYLEWNTRQETLWDVKKNTKLKSFMIRDYYKVSDFSAFRNSSIESLCLFGCNGFSSFTSKMHIKDFSFITDMPCLKELRIDIIKDEPSEYYLTLISKCQGLEIFTVPDSFFTFQQFAWLKSKLTNVKEGLDCVHNYYKDFYSIIGKRTPKNIDHISKTEKYQQRYDSLVKKYENSIYPPNDTEKD